MPQGPDGDEVSVNSQRGIHNNVMVDGADFNNPFFGEQRGGPPGRGLPSTVQPSIQNNVMLEGADFNNPFFGEQRGGQRAAFTFNLDAVEQVVVVANGANAALGRAGSGFVTVLTKAGTNDLTGSAHVFG